MKYTNFTVNKFHFSIVQTLSREYPHHLFTSTKGYLLDIFNKKKCINCGNQLPLKNDEKNKALQFLKFAKSIVNQLPYISGYLFYPILKPYTYVLESRLLGHELHLVAKKKQ